jgi:hypothetical protein
MIKTLAYLVVCMTGGAATLSWFEPESSVALPPEFNTPPVLAQVVDVSPALTTTQWKEIRIHHNIDQPADGSAPIPLQAHRPRRDYHFIVRPDGSLEASQAWRSQQPAQAQPGTISICVIGSNERPSLPSRQWKTLMRLIQELQARCGISPRHIQLDPDSDPTRCPHLSPQTLALHQLLSSVGLAN